MHSLYLKGIFIVMIFCLNSYEWRKYFLTYVIYWYVKIFASNLVVFNIFTEWYVYYKYIIYSNSMTDIMNHNREFVTFLSHIIVFIDCVKELSDLPTSWFWLDIPAKWQFVPPLAEWFVPLSHHFGIFTHISEPPQFIKIILYVNSIYAHSKHIL